MGGAEIKLVGGRIACDEVCDLMHFGHPAIGFRRHQRQIALEPGQHLRLAALQLGEQGIGGAAARRREQHRRAERLRALGDAGIGHLQRRSRAHRPLEHAHIEAKIPERGKARRVRSRGIKARACVVRLSPS